MERSKVPTATIKFYIREGMLPPGETEGSRRASYGDDHLARLRLIRALHTVADLPLVRIKAVLGLLDHPDAESGNLLREAISAIGDPGIVDGTPTPHAAVAMPSFVPGYEAHEPAMSMLDEALVAIEDAGVVVTPARLELYSRAMFTIAEAEVAAIPLDPKEAVKYTVLGTVVIEPLLIALRRLAQQSLANKDD
ncbi:MAG: MerR family transcriptional regulator [Cryobacterium sp.]